MGFKSFMEHFGHDLKVGIVDIGKAVNAALPYVATVGEQAVSLLFPAESGLFNKVVNEAITAEQNWAAAGKASGTGLQKSAAVLGIVGNLIEQGLKDAGLPSTAADVQKYVDMAVMWLNVTPVTNTVLQAVQAPAPSTPAAK